MTAHIVIPFRDRGTDGLRAANLAAVLGWWHGSPWTVHVTNDGRSGDEQFNRSAAYNRGAAQAFAEGADVVVYTESDMLVPWQQIAAGIESARSATGLVVPFTSYRYLSEATSEIVRPRPAIVLEQPIEPESTMEGGASIGAVNIVSRETMAAVGQWDETFEGSWYDDTAMFAAFHHAAGPTRWVEGPGWHLFHQPGWTGDHLTEEDKAATERNRQRFELYKAATSPERIRELTGGAR